jgi:hypothetical protein
MVVDPRKLADVISVMPAMWANCRSNGAATELAMISGVPPGSMAWTLIVGKSTCGNGAVGSCRNPTIPASTTAAVSSTVAIGRRMNGAEMPAVRPFCEGEFMPVQA